MLSLAAAKRVGQLTFLNTRYRLAGLPKSTELEALARLSTVYGIRRLSLEGPVLLVEYDASRLHEAEVLAAVRGAGLKVSPDKPIPAGAFDYTGAFKDSAWPTHALSPANQRQR